MRATIDYTGKRPLLMVDGRPFLAVGGELHNSTASDPAATAYWDHLVAVGINMVLLPIGWDQMEASEGSFDFSVVDAALNNARSRGIKLGLLWFGAYKNATSTYAPTWVRADTTRFPRAQRGHPGTPRAFSYQGQTPKPVLSVFSADLRRADTSAYVALVSHLVEVDADGTVILLQVENESGLLGDSRDRSPLAEEAWNAPVPQVVQEWARTSGATDAAPSAIARSSDGASWSEVFGTSSAGDEYFMAVGFASYVQTIAAAGKAVLPLPTYANAWLGPQPGQPEAGYYPSGGPSSRVIDVWRALGPDIDFVSPDIYIDDIRTPLEQYSAGANVLFVPEAPIRAGDLFLAVGHYGAIGYCAFGVDHLVINSQYSRAAALLRATFDELARPIQEGLVDGFVFDEGTLEQTLNIGDWAATVRDSAALFEQMLLDAGVRAPERSIELIDQSAGSPFGATVQDDRPFGLVAQVGDDEFIVIGQGIIVDFTRSDASVEVDAVIELRFDKADLIEGRHLNGDERLHSLAAGSISAIRVKLLRF